MNQTPSTGGPSSRMNGLWPDETGTASEFEQGPATSHDRPGEHPATGSANDSAEPYSRYLAELQEYAGHYLEAQWDRLRTRAFGLALTMLLAMVAGVLGLVILVVGGIRLVVGTSAGLSELFPSHPWAGDVITGLVVVLTALFGTRLIFNRALRKLNSSLEQKYDRRESKQRTEFGHSAADRAA